MVEGNFNLLADSLRPSLPRLGEILKSVRGIKLAGLEIEWRKGERTSWISSTS